MADSKQTLRLSRRRCLKAGSRRAAMVLSAVAATTLPMKHNAVAATLFWDPSPHHGSSGDGSGTWNTSLLNWYNGSTDVAWSNSISNTAKFGGTAPTSGYYAITLPSNIIVGSIIFNTSGYLLSGASIVDNASAWSISGPGTDEIDSTLTGTGTLMYSGNGNLTLGGGSSGTPSTAGSFIDSGSGTANIGGYFNTGNSTSTAQWFDVYNGGTVNWTGTGTATVQNFGVGDTTSGTLNVNSGTLAVSAANFFVGNGSTTGNLNVNGGNLTVSSGPVYIGDGSAGSGNGTGTLTITSGSFSAANSTINLGGATSAGTGTINLSGGTLSAATLNVNTDGSLTMTGGTLAVGTVIQSGGTAVFGSSSNSNLSQARYALAATSVGSEAIFAGGGNATAGSSQVDIYNSGNNTWSTGNLSQARYDLAATSVGGQALFAGGDFYPSVGASNVVDIYNSGNNTWSTGNLSQARGALSATSVGSQALFAGGYNPFTGFTNQVDIYNSGNNTWSTAQLSQARDFLAATSVGGRALFAGGYTGSALSAVVDIYNGGNNTWSTAQLSQARYFLAATSVGSQALFAGGFSAGFAPSNVVDIYNSGNNTWSTAQLSQARAYLAATTVGNDAFFAGGETGYNSGFSNVVDIYDASTGLWLTSTLSQARGSLAATTVGGQAIFAGGGSNNGASSVVDVLGAAQLSIGTGNNVGNYTLSGGSLTAQNIEITPGGGLTQTGGKLTAGSITQSGGNATFSGGFFISAGGSGYATNLESYTLSGNGSLNAGASTEDVDYGGTFTQSGGTNSAGTLSLGGQGLVGTYVLSGNGSLAAGSENIGQGTNVNGTFTQSGGVNSAANLYVGFFGTGNYTLSGNGSLTVSGQENISIGGNGNFTQTGGTNSAGAVIVGMGGAYNWTGGTLRINGPGSNFNGTLTVPAGGTLGGNGSVGGPVSLTASATKEQGGIIAAGADGNTTGTLTTTTQTWPGGAEYQWKLANAGSAAAVHTGNSGTPGTTTTWDNLSMTGLAISSGGANQPFTIALDTLSPPTVTPGQYSWTIAQIAGITTLPAGLTAPSQTLNASTGNLLSAVPTGGTNDLFALDTQGFTLNGVTAPAPGLFSLEFVGTGTGDNLVLDFSVTPEPGTMLLTALGFAGMVLPRRRTRKKITPI